MKPTCHVFTDSGCLVSNHETRIEQINKAPPSNHTVGERLKETGGTLNGCSGWHLVPENWVSANSRARPLTSVRKQVQSSKVIVDNRLCSVHVGGNKSAHYTGTDITCFQWSRRARTGMGDESVSWWIMHCSTSVRTPQPRSQNHSRTSLSTVN